MEYSISLAILIGILLSNFTFSRKIGEENLEKLDNLLENYRNNNNHKNFKELLNLYREAMILTDKTCIENVFLNNINRSLTRIKCKNKKK